MFVMITTDILFNI